MGGRCLPPFSFPTIPVTPEIALRETGPLHTMESQHSTEVNCTSYTQDSININNPQIQWKIVHGHKVNPLPLQSLNPPSPVWEANTVLTTTTGWAFMSARHNAILSLHV